MEFNFEVLDTAVAKTIKPFLIDQQNLYNPDQEGYHHLTVLPKAQPNLTREALEKDAKESLETAIRSHVNLLSQFELMPAFAFIKAADDRELASRTIDLLYGDRPPRERIQDYWNWSKIQKTDDGKSIGINYIVIGYLLAASDPTRYAFCKPSIYTAAAKAVLVGGEPKSKGGLDKVARLVHTSEFYQAALKLFQDRYQLPFEDLFHVHSAFFVMDKTYHGLPSWKDLIIVPDPTDLEPKSMPDLNVILYGPPGTGKTYDTIRRAVEICDGQVPDSRQELVRRYKKLCGENRVGFVTFHQSYGYEDFVEGIRPVLEDEEPGNNSEDNNAIQYECRPGIFKKICSLAKSTAVKRSSSNHVDLETPTIWKMSLGNTLDPDQAGIYDECLENNYLLLGHGRGIDFSNCSSRDEVLAALKAQDPEIKSTDYHIQAIDILKNQMKDGDLVIISDGNRKFRAIAQVKGHYQYLQRESYHQMRPVEWLLELEESLPYETINAKIFSQMALYKLRKKNLKLEALHELLSQTDDSPRNHVLIIDEVNRGNISKILGELITLLEPDKRLGAENELQVTLPYSGESFGVPSNVYVIGTMNTADRSIAFLDVALRRRFRFIEMMPETDLITELVGEEGVVADVDVAKLLETINDRIELLFDRDHQIGHSFFLGVETLLDLRDVFCHKVIPLLQEYFYGDWEKVCLVLGCPIAIAGNATPKNQNPIIKSRELNVELLIGESDSLLEDKIRCEVAPKFAKSSSELELLPFFEQVVQVPGSTS